ncbi:scn1 [Candida margitis]|uniref:scn1 n=1 Tax=Candida margitis TaxID=1775924 RepID=UPI0022272867|nr:scn1 [Candida margitis]KAI5961305.1 scn1 [Candida margitis]
MTKKQLHEPLYNLSDNHCHFSPEATREDAYKLADTLNGLDLDFPTNFFHLMTTQHIDIECIDILLTQLQNPDIVVPYFGVHPWFSHLFYTGTKPNKRDHYCQVLKPEPTDELIDVLPEPMSMNAHTDKMKEIIKKHDKKVYGIGEIGLDKLFRVPKSGWLGNPHHVTTEQDRLTKSRVTIEHQMHIFRHQLQLAEELGKQASIHCVKAHGVLYDEVTRYKNIVVVLHSYTGSTDQAKRWLKTTPVKLYFSLSDWINGEKDELLKLLVYFKKSTTTNT